MSNSASGRGSPYLSGTVALLSCRTSRQKRLSVGLPSRSFLEGRTGQEATRASGGASWMNLTALSSSVFSLMMSASRGEYRRCWLNRLPLKSGFSLMRMGPIRPWYPGSSAKL